MVWYNYRSAILCPLLFNIFINDLNFADDNTLHSRKKNLSEMFQDLVCDLKNISNWFKMKYLKTNPEKIKLMVLGRRVSDSCILISID